MSDVGQKVRELSLIRLKVNFGSNHSDAEEQGAAAFKAVTRVEVTVRMLR